MCLNDSLDEPQCQRYKAIDDTVDFEMMLQDVSSGSENPTLDRLVSKPVSENDRTLPQEHVDIKAEPECNSPEERSIAVDSQPINFSVSVTSSPSTGAAAVDGSRSYGNDDKTNPSSPDIAATSPVNCSSSDSSLLRKELAAALTANLALQEELSARDFHLAQLAEDFFCLHEQFKQLARHFQAVLGDIQPVSEHQTTRNHTS